MGHVTQDRSIDAENSALIRNQLHFKIYSNRKQLLYIVQLYFGSNQCRLGEQRKLLKKKKKHYKSYSSKTFDRLYTLQKCNIVM